MHPLQSGNKHRAGGLYDDVAQNIRNEQHADGIDRNPSMECAECEESYNWKDYWKQRIETEQIPNPHEDPFVCDTCYERKARLKRRKQENNQLGEFIE